MAGKDCLAGAFPQTERADFLRPQRTYRREAAFIEFPHRALVHDSGRVQAFGGFVDRRHQGTTVLFSRHRSLPAALPTQPLAPSSSPRRANISAASVLSAARSSLSMLSFSSFSKP